MPKYDPNKINTKNKQTSPQLQKEEELPMPKVPNNYIGAEILSLRLDQFEEGCVVVSKRDVNGSAMGRAHSNPILELWQYQVELLCGKITKFSTDIIEQWMYAYNDKDGNEYLLLDMH